MSARIRSLIPTWLLRHIEIRAVHDGIGEVVREVVARYMLTVSAARSDLSGRFTSCELRVIVGACDAETFRPYMPRVSFGGQLTGHVCAVLGGAPAELFAEHGLHADERAVLLAKLGALSLAEDLALVDAIEFYTRGGCSDLASILLAAT